MNVISVCSAAFCRADEITGKLCEVTGYGLVDDEMIVRRAGELSALPVNQLRRSFSAKPSVFNPFTRDRERSITWLKLAVAEYLQETGFLFHGVTAHLTPASIHHVLRIGLIADMAFRSKIAAMQLGVESKEAVERIQASDQDRISWLQAVNEGSDPWDSGLYDIFLPVHTTDVAKAAALVKQALDAETVQVSEQSRQAAGDFLMAARIQAKLSVEGHFVDVEVRENRLALIIDRPVLMQERLEEELRSVVSTVSTGYPIEIQIKPQGKENTVYSKYSSEHLSKVLLVDDEREFVQTLSERLEMRDIGSAVTLDGESALALISEDEPEVMLLDLRMPGIDGIEVLKRVKAEHPEIEVVILTGHGTNVDRKRCLELGAFAYLEKPVDIDVLSETLKRANKKMRQNAKRKLS